MVGNAVVIGNILNTLDEAAVMGDLLSMLQPLCHLWVYIFEVHCTYYGWMGNENGGTCEN